MSIDFLWKGLLLLSIGAIAVFIWLRTLSPNAASPVLSQKTSLDQQIKSTIQEQEKDQIDSFKNKITDKVLPAITENPLLSPLLETTREVKEAVQTVKSLPEDQKSAICQQVCK